MIPTTLILDFDGTVSLIDVGDELCARFGDPRWRELDAAWMRREIALPDAQREMWALVRAPLDQILEHARTHGAVREGFDELVAAAQAAGVELLLASGGFDFYIEAILGDRLRHFREVLVSNGVVGPDGVAVTFPLRERLGCGLCAVCKGRVCDEVRAAGRRILYAGDGSSDLCAIGRADEMWAVRGSRLAEACREAGAPCREFEAFTELIPSLESRRA